MSLKRYLFLIFSAVILVLTALQLTSLWWLQQRMNTAVIDSSQDLSKELIRLALQEADLDFQAIVIPEIPSPPDPVRVHREDMRAHSNEVKREQLEHEIEHLTDQMDEIGDAYEELHENLEYPLDERQQRALAQKQRQLERRSEHLSRQLAQRVEQQVQLQLQALETSRSETTGQLMVQHLSDDGERTLILENLEIPELENWERSVTLHSAVWISFVLICLSALLATYWLSHHISQPLAKLSEGHKRLAAGEQGVSVTPEGTQELRQTIQGFNSMAADLNELAQLRSKQQDLQQLAELGEVSRGIAHALRNPLHMIGLALEQLANTEDPEQAAKLQQQIRQKMARMDGHIRNLMALSPNQGETQPVPLQQLLQDIQLELATHPKHPAVVLKGDMSEIKLNGNETELRSILHTLLVNAVEAAPEKARVHIVAKSSDEGLKVLVEDEGEGIDPGVKETLFQPHVSSKADGAGMGLYIARRLMRQHYQGDLTLTEKPSGGCIAILSFPRGSHV
ncbi:HAMP domain-containing sensor histidine kinase [Corallincola platygyrae]|uniref:histidine kinase n=1 Tax=Corallincola platygyrae TaxID=1193278 RepID=A0ABW4XLX0_9GAMM